MPATVSFLLSLVPQRVYIHIYTERVFIYFILFITISNIQCIHHRMHIREITEKDRSLYRFCFLYLHVVARVTRAQVTSENSRCACPIKSEKHWTQDIMQHVLKCCIRHFSWCRQSKNTYFYLLICLSSRGVDKGEKHNTSKDIRARAAKLMRGEENINIYVLYKAWKGLNHGCSPSYL